MQTLVYQIVTARTDPEIESTDITNATEATVDRALYLFRNRTIPDSIFREVTVADDTPPARLTSETGQEYIQDAFDRTEPTVTDAIETLRNALNCTDTDTAPDWQTVLDTDDVQRAAFQLGHARGPQTLPYGMRHGLGLRTPTELEDHIETYSSNDADEYLVIVPLITGH